MVAVATAAVLLGGYVEFNLLRRRSAMYRDRAREHSEMEMVLREIAAREGSRTRLDISPGPGLRTKPFTIPVVIDFEAGLKRKYERAARYPWLSVAPDPIMPE